MVLVTKKEHKAISTAEKKKQQKTQRLPVYLGIVVSALCMNDAGLLTWLMAQFVMLYWQYCIDVITVIYNYMAHSVTIS